MWLMLKPSKRSSRPGGLCALGVGSLCTLILCGYALGQEQPAAESNAGHKPKRQMTTKAEPRSEADTATKAGPNARAKPGRSTVTPPKAGATDKRGQASARRTPVSPRRGASSFKMDPNAKFVCENRTVTLDPAWRNGKDLTFPFSIRNDGTADLKIQAKGG